MKTAVLYLARAAESPAAMEAFRDSYLRFSANYSHDLIVIYKGGDAGRPVFRNVPHIGIDLSDTGYDIGSYRAAAEQIDHDLICCLNTFSQIAAADWLGSLAANLRNDVGIVGATGSYESYNSSMRLYHYLIWICSEMNVGYDPAIASHYDFLLTRWAPNWLAKARPDTLKRKWKRYWKTRRMMPGLIAKVSQRWETDPHEYLQHVRSFPEFPNPHIRSNAFMIRRVDFLGACRNIDTKMDALLFESGQDNMTRYAIREGKKALIVDRHGEGFTSDKWPDSLTFRLGKQQNVLITDNQTREFDATSVPMRRVLRWITWGDPPHSSIPTFGCRFPVSRISVDRRSPAASLPR